MLNFDKHDAALLNAMGFTCERCPADWHDDGDAENGPHLVGGPAYELWSRPIGNDRVEVVVVCEGEIREVSVEPNWADYEAPF